MKPVQDEQLAREELARQGAQLAREMLALFTSVLRQRAKMSQEGLTDVQIQQLRYSLMMTELARFFRDVSPADDLANEFANLSRIFLGLTEGVSHPIVKPSIPATSNDRPDVWSARSKAALAMECLLLCKTRKVAAKFAAKNAPGLELLITRRRGDKVDLEKSLLSWLRMFRDGQVSDFQSQEAFNYNLPSLISKLAGRKKDDQEALGLDLLKRAEKNANALIGFTPGG